METELSSKVFDFWRGKSLSEGIGNHFTGRIVDESNLAVIDHPVNEVEVHINMLGVCMVLVILHEHNCRLVVRVQSSGIVKSAEDLINE